MFFSPELLAVRDSGFGLLWLAATIGSKSTFKKLPKRSVLTADIAQLCDLIAEPAEPLALRLSSNLMVGVVRVYKVKQDIFLTDITNCITSLKKVVQDFKSTAAMDVQFQMAHPTARSSALDLTVNPKAAYIMDFDALVADWDGYLNIRGKEQQDDDDDDDFDPKGKRGNRERKPKALPLTETVRADKHTLTEHYDHVLSASFDLSFDADGGTNLSSSQAEAFAFSDNFFAPSDGLDVGGGLGDELARELGDGWGASPIKNGQCDMDLDFPMNGEGFNLGRDFDPVGGVPASEGDPVQDYIDVDMTPISASKKRKAISSFGKENLPLSSFQGSLLTPRLSPATSFSRMLLSQDELIQPFNDITAEAQNQIHFEPKRNKKTRLLLDARTELTDEELKTARAQYLKAQILLGREIGAKKLQKDTGRIIEEIVWGVPCGIQSQALADFWQENFKVQVEARSGALEIHQPGQPPVKRRKIMPIMAEDSDHFIVEFPVAHGNFDMGMDIDIGGFKDAPPAYDAGHYRSSEEPGQGRHGSRPPSALGGSNFGFDLGIRDPLAGSQKSSLFPWDNAGASSSSGGNAGMPGSDNIMVDHVEVRLRGSSQGKRDSSLVPSQFGSMGGGPGFSPAPIKRTSQALVDDYAFELDLPNNSVSLESQRSDSGLISLERNSFNFLEYAKMQYQSLPGTATGLAFDTIVPTATSTRHVAAAAFYHCLVLGTKDLLRLKQPRSYGQLIIEIV